MAITGATPPANIPETNSDDQAEPEDIFPVVIIGGGLAGLTAAVHLAERGITPLLIDADSFWTGGRLNGGEPDTFTFDGKEWAFRPDHGVHALWGGYNNMRAMLTRFTNVELTRSTGEDWINRWGREVRTLEAGNAVRYGWLPAPFHYLQLLFNPRIWSTITPLDFLSLPGFLFSILWTVGLDPIREEVRLEGLTIKDFFRGWTPNLRMTFTGLGQNLLAAPSESISLTGLIAALRFYTVLRRDSWQMEYLPGNSHDHLIMPLTRAIEERGGMIRRGVTAQKLIAEEGYLRVIVEDSDRRGLRSIRAKHIILATNAPSAKRLLHASPATAPVAETMQFPNGLRNVVVRMWFSTAPKDGTDGGMFTGDFVPDNFFWLHRLYDEFKAWHEETGGSAIEVHIYGNEKLLDQPDRNLLITAIDEVQRAFPVVRGAFVHGAVRRNSRGHTEFRVPMRKDSLFVDTPWSGVYACGDWIGYDTPSLWMERATTTGIAAANHVIEHYQRESFPLIQIPPPGLLVRGLALIVRGIRIIFAPIVRVLRGLRQRNKSR
ncbi:MAG: FAD-dependent oxidoreductase [Aggregatilineales bacterium]